MTGRGSGEGSPSVLWLFGPPGVGKTTVGWSLYRAWSADGTATGYVDIDQVGMLYPTSDPRNHRVKAGNLAAVLRSFAAAGVRRVIVSGVLDPDEMGGFARSGAGSEWVWCRLTATTEEIRDRLIRHRNQPGMVEDSVAHARLLDGEGFDGGQLDNRDLDGRRFDGEVLADVRVDTSGKSVDEIASAVRKAVESRAPDLPSRVVPAREQDRAAAVPAEAASAAPPDSIPAVLPGTVIAVTGPRGVGKSTVAWAVFERVQREGHVAAFIDLEQVGFVSVAAPSSSSPSMPAPSSSSPSTSTSAPAAAATATATATPSPHTTAQDVRVRNVGAMARVFGESGATVLVLSGAIGDREEHAAYAAALAPAALTVVRLRAGEDALRERVGHRAVQRVLHLPGDDLRGLSPASQHEVVHSALQDGARLAAAGVGQPIDTDGRSVDQIAGDILALVRRGSTA